MESNVLKSNAQAIFKQNRSTLYGFGIVLFVLSVVQQVMEPLRRNILERGELGELIGLLVSSTLITLVFLVARFWFYRYLLALVRHENNVNVNSIISKGVPWIKLFFTNILITLAVTVGLILLIVPGIVLTLAYSQTYRCIANNPEIGILDAMRESRLMMVGHKWEYFLLWCSFILWYVSVIFTCGLTSISVTPYTELTYMSYYLYLRGESLDKAPDNQGIELG